ncbi:MAG: hypothetical protein Q8R00_00815 [Candidatus Nanoarchaeia archaeon]|nr:hypothetical protein [Candidatus Nanoarchaeia archaeon]
MNRDTTYLIAAILLVLFAGLNTTSYSSQSLTGYQTLPTHCSNNIWDSDESDVDCGGFSCSPCADTFSCWENFDCSSSFCYTDPNTMNSRIQAGLYPGGTRPQPISSNIQYQGVCQSIQTTQTYPTFGSIPYIPPTTTTTTSPAPTTQPLPQSCTDGVMNGYESDVDCGGPSCNACALSKTCNTDSDCITGKMCLPSTSIFTFFGINFPITKNICSLPLHCSDNALDGDESDVDCGGSCSPCPNPNYPGTDSCWTNSDCASNYCFFNTQTTSVRQAAGIQPGQTMYPSLFYTQYQGVCQIQSPAPTTTATATCTDGIKNQQESDVDCGGSCSPCLIGKSCTVTTDCVTSATCINALCTAPTPTTTTTTTQQEEEEDEDEEDEEESTTTTTTTTKKISVCGNGIREFGEQCDDGNTFEEDGCSALCEREFCGDRIIQRGLKEECDPPNGVRCSISCKLIPTEVLIPGLQPFKEPLTSPVSQQPQEQRSWLSLLIIVLVLATVISLWFVRKKKLKKETYKLPIKYMNNKH